MNQQIDKVIYQGTTVIIDSKKTIGSGGEAIIVKYNKLAFKIYHDPTIQRAKKLTDFIKSNFVLPSNVMAPIDLLYDTRNRVVGFAMNIASGCRDVKNLLDVNFRSQKQIGTSDVIQFFARSKSILDALHNIGLIVGDFNDLNELFDTLLAPYFIDVDSFQFGKYPCVVGTEEYIDPTLYGVDLTKKPTFTKETDWYSFNVMLFRALLFVHPYAGVHKQYKSLFTRAANAVWIFDQNVIRPKVAIHPETLDDDLLHHFSNVFCKKQRLDLPVQKLQDISNTFVKCNKCGVYFSNTRQKCPQCQKVVPQSVVDLSNIINKKQIGKETCSISDLFETTGMILFLKIVSNEKLVVVYYEDNVTRCKYISSTFVHECKIWDGLSKTARFDFFEPYCLAIHVDNHLMLVDISADAKPITSTVTMDYSGDAVFSSSRNGLYRLTSNAVLRGEISNGHFIEHEVASALEDQTWITVGQNDLGFGFYRTFNKYLFFVFSKKGRYELTTLPELRGQLIDFDVKISVNTVLLLRKNLDNGRTYSHWQIINDEGKILETKSEESISSDLLKNIYGKAFAGSVIIHPTDAGVAVEKHGDVSLKVSTAEFVTSSNQLDLYKQGLLVRSTNKVSYIILK